MSLGGRGGETRLVTGGLSSSTMVTPAMPNPPITALVAQPKDYQSGLDSASDLWLYANTTSEPLQYRLLSVVRLSSTHICAPDLLQSHRCETDIHLLRTSHLRAESASQCAHRLHTDP